MRGSGSFHCLQSLTPFPFRLYPPPCGPWLTNKLQDLQKQSKSTLVLTGTRMGPPNPDGMQENQGQRPKGKFHSSERQKLLPDPAAKRGRLSFLKYRAPSGARELCQWTNMYLLNKAFDLHYSPLNYFLWTTRGSPSVGHWTHKCVQDIL